MSLSRAPASRSMRGIISCVVLVLLVGSIFHLRAGPGLEMPDLPKDLMSFGEKPAEPPTPSDPTATSVPPQGDSVLDEVPGGTPAGIDSSSSEASLPTSAPQATLESFYDIAMKHGTDKVTTHSYHHMYTKYLEPIRTQKLKMLEIGLGCDMSYGPGKSYYTWLEFLPNVDLYFMEYDGKCAEKWASATTGATIIAGDQANVTFLTEFKQQYGSDFDIIIDDGGHTMKQQITSLDWLFDAVKPGGIYFVEDLQTSYMPAYGGQEGNPNTMMEQIKSSLDDLILNRPRTAVMKEMYGVDCMREVCAFAKKVPGEVY